MAYVERVLKDEGLVDAATLDVGSYDTNGSLRTLFCGEYLGIDMREGPNVDRVMNAEALDWPDAHWPLVVSAEMLEHCRRPWRAIAEMARVGRVLILTARGYDERGCFGVHDYPHDYWRFSRDGMRLMLEDSGLRVIECLPDPEVPGVFALARR